MPVRRRKMTAIIINANPLVNIPEKLYKPKMVLNQWGSKDIIQSKLEKINMIPPI